MPRLSAIRTRVDRSGLPQNGDFSPEALIEKKDFLVPLRDFVPFSRGGSAKPARRRQEYRACRTLRNRSALRYKGQMKASIRVSSLFAICLALGAMSVSARAADTPSGMRALFLRQLADVEKKMNSLAAAVPAEKYSWRPGAGVRSISEVFTHVAGANYFFPSIAGVKPPEGIDRNMEKTVTEKSKVQAALKQSFEHARQAIEGLSDADMAKEVKFFGQPSTVEVVIFTMANHMHEHLGQSIAYARVNGVVPPWSAKE
jgi:uncharacterized damage-inducible protein DinB